MKTSSKLLVLAAAVAGLASNAFAATLVLSENAYSNGSNGGSYTASAFGTGLSTSSYIANPNGSVFTATSFETFCLEPTEYFSPGSTYNYTIDSAAIGGANEATGRNSTPGDQLSKGTSLLYSLFATGQLANFNYSPAGHEASNLLLQRAIWYLEDDYPTYSSAANAIANNVFLSFVASQFGTLAAAQADAANGANGVYVLNLTSYNGQTLVQNQSQLYYHVTSVPESASTIALLGLGLLGFVGFRRKFAK